jgi:hypothetical protein
VNEGAPASIAGAPRELRKLRRRRGLTTVFDPELTWACLALKTDLCRFYSLPGCKVLGFKHHMVLSSGERDMRRRGGAHQTIIDEDTKAQVVTILPL